MNEIFLVCKEKGGVYEFWVDKCVFVDGILFNSGSFDISGEFSECEFQILQLIVEGQMNKEIVCFFVIFVEMVKWYIKNIYVKFKVNSCI